MRRFFACVSDSTVSITDSEANHIRNVLRLGIGDKIILFDGKGSEYEARIDAISTSCVKASILKSLESSCESPAEITIAQAFLKEKKTDELIRPLTELGISRLIPFISRRFVSRPDEKRLKNRIQRWESIAKESAKQCRRVKVPEISQILSFEEVLNAGKDCDVKLIFWENASEPISAEGIKIIALLGPEGGFEETEIRIAEKAGFTPVTLGRRILRAETATVAVCTLLQYIFGDMGRQLSKDKHHE